MRSRRMLSPNSLSHGERALGLDTQHLSEELRLTETAYAPYFASHGRSLFSQARGVGRVGLWL